MQIYTAGDNVTFTVTASDNVTEASKLVIETVVSFGNTTVTAENGTFTATNAGEYKISVKAKDEAGNIGTAEITISVEEYVPTIYEIRISDESGNLLKKISTEDGGAYTLPPIEKIGYDFAGWWGTDDSEFAASGTVSANTSIVAKYTLAETKTFEELKTRIEAGVDRINIAADILLTDTIFVVSETTVFTTEDHTLTRAEAFLGDLFVIGETPEGDNVIEIFGTNAKLTVKTEGDAKLSFEGNKSVITSTVTGSAFLIVNSSTLNLESGVTVQNFKKTGNLKAAEYEISNPHKAGGAAVMVINGILNLNGASLLNNEVTLEDAVEGNTELGISSCGGAVYNYGTVNINGGIISGNTAARGAAIFNYRNVNVKNGTIENNNAAVYGGGIYLAATQYGELTIGVESAESDTYAVVFKGNTAERAGGAIFSQTKNSVIIYGSTLFEANVSKTSNGGAINTSGALTIKDAVFTGNIAASKGGALYIYCSDDGLTVRQVSVEKALFDSNKASKGGAFACSASSSSFTKGAIGYIGDVTFKNNEAFLTPTEDPDLPDDSGSAGEGMFNGFGGAIYVARKGDITIDGAKFENNICGNNGGAVYATGNSIINISNSTFTANKTTGDKGGAMYITGGTNAIIEQSDFIENIAENFGGVMSAHSAATVTFNECKFESNASLNTHGGAISVFSNAVVNVNDSEFNFNKAVCIEYAEDGTTVSSTTGKGGAIHLQGDTEAGTSAFANLKNCTFNGNSAGEHGGAINLYQGSTLKVDNCTFTGNKTETKNGGALYSSGSSASLKDTVFDSNKSADNGGAVYFTTSTLTATGCTFKNNSSVGEGGALYLTKSQTFTTETPSADEFASNVFEANKSETKGGAIYITNNTVFHAKNISFIKNASLDNGGAVTAADAATITITGLYARENTSKNGGVFYFTGKAIIDLYEVEAISNTATLGGFIYVTTTGTVINLHSKAVKTDGTNPISANTATDGGNLIWSNTAKCTIGINFNAFPELRFDASTDADGVDNLADGYSDEIGFSAKDTIEELAS